MFGQYAPRQCAIDVYKRQNPLYAAGLCLIVNTAPVAFGAMGIPILVAGQVTGIGSFAIGQMVGRQLPFLTIIVLFWIMAIMDGWRGIKETLSLIHISAPPADAFSTPLSGPLAPLPAQRRADQGIAR